MEFSEYQGKALRTASGLNQMQKIYNGVLGLNGESGECADLLKKHLFQGHPLDITKLIEEVGDVLWYCSLLADGLNVELGWIADMNIVKLNKRYPEGFDPEKSMNREKEKENGK